MANGFGVLVEIRASLLTIVGFYLGWWNHHNFFKVVKTHFEFFSYFWWNK
jgi:hypothetical protein